jgi:hypothetical protein
MLAGFENERHILLKPRVRAQRIVRAFKGTTGRETPSCPS